MSALSLRRALSTAGQWFRVRPGTETPRTRSVRTRARIFLITDPSRPTDKRGGVFSISVEYLRQSGRFGKLHPPIVPQGVENCTGADRIPCERAASISAFLKYRIIATSVFCHRLLHRPRPRTRRLLSAPTKRYHCISVVPYTASDLSCVRAREFVASASASGSSASRQIL